MTPSDFSWKADQQVTVTNPTAENFRFQVHAKWYEVGPGQTAKMPGYIAWAYVYKLAMKIAISDKQFDHWNDEGFRQEYYNKIVKGSESAVHVVNPEPEAETFDEADELPESGDLEENLDEVKPMKRKTNRAAKAKDTVSK